MKKNSRAVKIGGAILAAIVGLLILFALFDWNMLKPYINRKVSETTGREFAIQGNLDVKFHRGLDSETGWRRYVPRPYVSAEDIRMSNPAWSTVGRQMASAKKVDMGFRILPLLGKEFVITDLRLAEPNVALQRRKDGSNSWTLKDNGPSEWEVDIQRLAFASGTLRYLDEAIGLDLNAQAKSINGNTTPAAPGAQPYGLAFTLGGRYNKAPVTGGGKAGAVLTLTGSDITFPVEANADLGGNRISVKGTLSDPKSLSGMDLQLKLAGPSMADLYPLTGVLLPSTPPYETHGRLLGEKNDANAWTFTYQKFSGKVGASDIAGTLAYSQRKPRPLLRGELTSQQLRLADLGPSVGADTGAGTKQAGKVKAPPAGKALPVNEFNTAKWGALDADVKFTGKRIVRTNDIPLENLVADLHMKDKVLKLTPLSFGMAGGKVTSNISLDGRDKAIDAQARVAARHLKINRLFPKLESMRGSFGEINGDAALAGRGNTVASMLATSNGELNAVVTEGSVSQFILELAGLNVANAVFVKVFGDKQINMNCLAAEAAVRNGRANVQRFVLDTDEAVVDVSGYVDLAQEQLNLDVRPKTKGTRIFSLRTPLYAKGTFADPDVGPYKGPLALKAGAAIALGAVSPLAAVLPLVNVSKVPDTNCKAAIAEAEKAPQVRELPKSVGKK
ncbi:AsmA family protein [Pseudoduganella sp. SL102]|uniref:AsmA family protein n=1 Tax=Pseudoduganella sp. SL102 TaxID=2995154 RepID=UPI00248ADD28|nr:AsmA family protein [Pseudoduganella sp. SL102]WBS04883.1 AsmA family protein [Pseudoduganella sp. SL102]